MGGVSSLLSLVLEVESSSTFPPCLRQRDVCTTTQPQAHTPPTSGGILQLSCEGINSEIDIKNSKTPPFFSFLPIHAKPGEVHGFCFWGFFSSSFSHILRAMQMCSLWMSVHQLLQFEGKVKVGKWGGKTQGLKASQPDWDLPGPTWVVPRMHPVLTLTSSPAAHQSRKSCPSDSLSSQSFSSCRETSEELTCCWFEQCSHSRGRSQQVNLTAPSLWGFFCFNLVCGCYLIPYPDFLGP